MFVLYVGLCQWINMQFSRWIYVILINFTIELEKKGFAVAEVLISPSTLYVRENDSATLTCTLTGGESVKHISWYKRRNITSPGSAIGILSSSCQSLIVTINTRLYGYTCPSDNQMTWIIKNATRENNGEIYHCNIETQIGNENSKGVLLSFEDGPDDIGFSPNETRHVYHEYAMFSPVTCMARCEPPCSYQWTKVGREQSVNDSSLLDLGTLTRSEDGTYICTATTPGGFFITKELSVSVLSFYVEGRETETHVTVTEYDNVQFVCNAGSRFSSTAKIMFKDKIVKEGDDSNTISLTFMRHSVSCTHRGVYTCEGDDLFEEFAINVTLNVRCTPRPLRQIRQEVSSRLKGQVTFTFTAIAFPEPGPAGFIWNKENGDTWTPLLSNEDIQIESSELQSNLTILSVTQHDFVKYRVTATNEVGSYEQYMFLVEEGGIEQHTTKCSETNAIVIGAILGIATAAFAVYSISLTIWVKRNCESKGKTKRHGKRKEQTYANESFIENVGAEQIDNKDTQYTSLDDTAKDRNVTYETLQTT